MAKKRHCSIGQTMKSPTATWNHLLFLHRNPSVHLHFNLLHLLGKTELFPPRAPPCADQIAQGVAAVAQKHEKYCVIHANRRNQRIVIALLGNAVMDASAVTKPNLDSALLVCGHDYVTHHYDLVDVVSQVDAVWTH